MGALIGFQAAHRAVLRMLGEDARRVLQDVVTNDVTGLETGAVYAALLTPQGKYLFDFFLVAEGDAVLIDVDADRAPALAQRLKMYCLRRDARLEASERSVWLAWPDGQGLAEPPAAPPDANAAADQAPIIVTDPRDSRLGWRIYGAPGPGGGSPEAYDALRVALTVPETGAELLPDDTYILEAGFERLKGVDFRKGCYVGQEVTARMKHKTTLRKGLVQVQVAGATDPGTEILAENGKPVGRIFTQAHGRGLAHLRFDRAGPGMRAGQAEISYQADA